MAQSSFPFEGIDTTETQFSQWARHFNNGVNDEPTGTALEVSAGTGLAVDVEAGQAMVRGHYYVSTATESLALATADATNDRIDLVVLKLDPVANSIVLNVKTGTPAGSPSAPTPVQTDAGVYEQPLAEVLVPATAGVPGTITDRREFMGTRLGSWSTAGRPTPAGRVLFGFNTDTERIEFYNVNTPAWEDVTPASIGDIGDVTITGTPGDGELLAYDSGTSEWVNQALETAQLPTGTILQVVSTTKTDTFTSTSTSFTDITGLSATITPSSTSSKVLAMCTLGQVDHSSLEYLHLKFQRNGTDIAVGDAAGSRTRAGIRVVIVAANRGQSAAWSHLDSPASTSALTYKAQIVTGGGTMYVNRGSTDTDAPAIARTVSTMTLIEVAG